MPGFGEARTSRRSNTGGHPPQVGRDGLFARHLPARAGQARLHLPQPFEGIVPKIVRQRDARCRSGAKGCHVLMEVMVSRGREGRSHH